MEITPNHGERVEKTAALFEESEFNWDVTRLDNQFSADIIVQKMDVYPEPKFAVVVSAGNPMSAFRKMNPFAGTDYYWLFVPVEDTDNFHKMRSWFSSLGVSICDISAENVEVIINYCDNNTKLPVDYSDFPYDKSDRLERLGWDETCLETLKKRYQHNSRAFIKGDGDPKVGSTDSNFNFSVGDD